MNLTFKPMAPVETPKKNRFLEETFDEFKTRIFKRNHERLNFLIHYRKDMFVGYDIKKFPGMQIDLMRGGTVIARLFNHEVNYYISGELTDFLKMFIKMNANEPLNQNISQVAEIVKQFNGETNPFIE